MCFSLVVSFYTVQATICKECIGTLSILLINYMNTLQDWKNQYKYNINIQYNMFVEEGYIRVWM